MKKEYGTPKAEKVAFDYSEAVLAASNGGCHWEQPDGFTVEGCINSQTGPGTYVADLGPQ